MSTTTSKKTNNIANISVLTFAVMNITTVLSTRGLAPEAEYGLTSIFYYLFAAVCFLVPVSLVAAELATGWPQKGGVFNWIGAAFGKRMGFVAIYLQWLATTICFPTMLIFIAVSIAFIDKNHAQAIAANKYYILSVVLGIYWFATYTTSKGIKSAAKISAAAGIIGTIIPLLILFISGLIYVFCRDSVDFPIAENQLVPDFHQFHNLVLASSVFLFYSGMEINAVHVQQMDNPSKNYPKAIAIASSLTVVFLVLGTLLISAIVPHNKINLVESLFITYDTVFNYFHMPWMSQVITAAIAIGVFGQITVIVAGPSTGLFQVGQEGYLPKALQKSNGNGVQMPILYVQGLIVTVLSFVLVVLPSVQSAFQILGQLASILYLIMYLMLFSGAIYLRYKSPEVDRPYKIPFGNVGIWFVGLLGLFSSFLALSLSFVPPSQINTGSASSYITMLIILTLVFLLIPLVIYHNRKNTWLPAK
ncbi:Glutamate/gamma-aminobutyrate antiporter [Vibrio stylophorae]|uniref:Glutamate/gamma-aminobutyrate antiporter n=1 Tax=Vibrio stylophorae TaxID=659351 RepID=A0ABM8ZTG4_9VIBR|nr:putative glutamine/gamma-aminobutyrate antiporter GadC [Vibrio stylophorae]CAH0533616.1 Glutamate/gamma-aminobutyrate antiporter [Vibrio stylophorae]